MTADDKQAMQTPVKFRLPAVLDLAASEQFLANMRDLMAGERKLYLDASAVEVLTLPCAQIILSAAQSQADVGVGKPSDAFINAFEEMALAWPEAAFPDPDDVAGAGTAAGVARAADDEAGTGDQPLAAPAEGPSEAAPTTKGDAAETQMDSRPMTKRILTIDDSKTMRDMLLLTLTDAGFEVLQGVDGRDGIDVLGDQRVDVVITDINMPKMDGYQVIRELRADPRHKTTPILVLTTESDTEKRQLARDAGATGWMVKPFDPEGLVAVINKVSP